MREWLKQEPEIEVSAVLCMQFDPKFSSLGINVAKKKKPATKCIR